MIGRYRHFGLAAGTCLSLSFALPAVAGPSEDKIHAKAHVPQARTPAHNGRAFPAKHPVVEELTVASHRPPHATLVSVGAAEIAREIPGANPMKALATIPGVMFQSADPQGLDTWSAQLYVHGFQQQEIGMTLDGIPLGEMSYRNYNGLNPIQAISSENVARLDVTKSAGAEDVAATNNLGGSINYVSSDPLDRTGGRISQSFGSYNAYHTFIRFDSGILNHTGTKAYMSYMRNETDEWKGTGKLFMQQVNAKLVQPVGDRSRISAFFDWSDLHMNVYDDYSLEMLHKLGPNLNYYQNGKLSGYQTALNAARGIYIPGVASLSDPLDAAYYSGGTNNVDLLGGLNANLALTDRLSWVTTLYGHNQQNQTTWVSPYWPSPNGSPLSDIVKEPEIRRFGFQTALKYTIARHAIASGVWFENNHYLSPMYSYAEPDIVNGQLTGPILNDLGHFSDPFAKIFSQNYNTNTLTGYFQDVYRPLPDLAFHFGFKSVLNTTRVGDGFLNAAYYGSSEPITSGVGQTVAKAFLPHLGIDYRFMKNNELFVDISQNVHTYAQSGYKLSASPFAVLQSAYDASASRLRPETAWTYAMGYRHTGKLLSGDVYLYRTNFFNRLQQITAGSVINPVSAVANVGGVTMNGVDASLTFRPLRNLSLVNSFSYDHATYDQNLEQQEQMYRTKGVQIVNYPRFMYKARLSYQWGHLDAYIDGSYTSSRNLSYVGDTKIPGYWMSDIGATYDFGAVIPYVQSLKASLNISNLAGTQWISTVGEAGNPLSRSTGAYSYQSFMIGSPRLFFGSLSAGF